ncbi:MAG: ATP-binding protein [Archangium sp.]
MPLAPRVRAAWSSTMGFRLRVVSFLQGLGAAPGERPGPRAERELVVLGGTLMSFGGLVWGTLALSQGLHVASSIPYGYTLLTAVNFWWFARHRDLRIAKVMQVLLSMLLPFFFQWALGGFVRSGGVMLWSMIALVGSLTFSSARASFVWLSIYCVLTVVSGLLDSRIEGAVAFFPSPTLIRVFFVLNISAISAIVFSLAINLNVRQRNALERAELEHQMSGRLSEELLEVLGERERDIEQLRNAEEALRASSEQLSLRVEERTAELRAALERAESATRAKSQFLATMSHEIRTPLNGILGTTDFLQTTRLDDTQTESMRVIKRSGELLLTILNDVLDFSRIEAGKLVLVSRQFDPRAEVLSVVGLHRAAASAKGVQLIAVFDDSVPALVEGDGGRLMQVLGNLLGNAVKFTSSGSISVRVRSQDEGNQVRLHFSVVDTGIGIPRDQLPRLFAPFTQVDSSSTREYGGSGLGLSICARLVEKFGGSIAAFSDTGRGTTVAFEVVLTRSTAPASATPDAPDALPPVDGLSVLIVEDNRVNQIVASRLVEKLGARVALANDGVEALERLEAQTFDVLLMDLQMPRLDGLQTTRAIRQLNLPKQPRIVALTANAFEADVSRCLSAGMDDFLSKPLRLEALHRALATGRSGPSPALVG